MRGSIERQPASVSIGEIGLVGKNGPDVLRARATSQRRSQFHFQMHKQRSGRGEQQVAGPRFLNGAAAKCQNQRLPSGQPCDGRVFAFAEFALPVSREEFSNRDAGLQPNRAANRGPTVLLPEPMKPVRTMRRGNVETDWSEESMVILSSYFRNRSFQYKEAVHVLGIRQEP